MYDVASAPISSVLGLDRLLAGFAAWRRRHAAYVQTYNELSSMGDRELADLNLSRADFHHLALTESNKVA
ncbi:DUF1127 domain-containing protein [Tropicimonas sp. IMCC34043]|uniref:DUF1127 domain-containing protein n=1 Tax=Tropicimonas sp. IMCC34043 TaxID=2248760 RepID=UPI00130085ED|nr:DUF1127 domain-containing protein [Tropicimonas sp. IMCC34043]